VVSLAPAVAQQMEAELQSMLRRAAERIAARARIAIQSPPKTGRIYERGGKVHQASAPGEAPATDTGFLVNSIGSRSAGHHVAEVFAGASYAIELELGTSRMEPRPFMLPAAQAERPHLERELRRLTGD